jgi:hypothetical protein
MRALAEVLARVAELERKVAGGQRSGFVHEVDPGAGTVRLKLGDGPDGPFLSPPIPYAQTMGALKAHIPPVVGQSMTMLAPGGDWRQAVAISLSASDSNPSPSGAADQNVITFGSVTITLQGSGLVIEAGGCTVTISGDGLSVDGGMVRHNGTDIGDTHTHSGITPGPANTGPPN